MLEYTLKQKLRRFISKLPGAKRTYDFYRLHFRAAYNEDGLVTVHNADFLKDDQFLKAYNAALHRQPGTYIHWRAHVTQWAGYHAKQLEGDFVECGVNRAFLSSSVMEYIDFKAMHDRKFYLFDTYCGLVEDLVSDEDHAAHRNLYTDCYEYVKNSFLDHENVIVVKGIVPDSLHTVSIKNVAYLSIDMNCVQPEIEALRFFWPKMVPGGIIVLDDYGFSGHEAQKRGADEFADQAGVKVLSMPTGQGLLIKPAS